jgi:hypothetical protein
MDYGTAQKVFTSLKIFILPLHSAPERVYITL